ncbi:MAG TPA: MmcQ/YjbR family DNA-binding protein [Clostridia bacterium]|nr:MmcQ/YjbR family DNA-binding protein [Clostridia bacterium]
MNTDSVRQHCLSLPYVTETVQWGDDLVFKVAGKMFVIMCLEPGKLALSFKATPEAFYELQEIEGIIPAPYMARAQWVALERFNVLRDDELRDRLNTSYRLVFEKLPRKVQQELEAGRFTTKKMPAGTKKPTAREAASPAAEKVAVSGAKKSTRKKSVQQTKHARSKTTGSR